MSGLTHPHAESGSSLVELMIAAMLGVVFVGAVLTLTSQQESHHRTNVESSLAVTAALDNLERVRDIPHDQLASLDGVGFDVRDAHGGLGGLAPVEGDLDGLPGLLRVSVEADHVGETLYRVAAIVAWQGSAGKRRMRLETLIGGRR